MMDYCARESTICEGETCAEPTTSEIVKSIRKELAHVIHAKLSECDTSLKERIEYDCLILHSRSYNRSSSDPY